jgi:hypothetical protein
MPRELEGRRVRIAMYARAVDDASARLRDLRREEWGDLGVGALALGLAIAATQLRPSFALPFFLGGLAVGSLGIRALWRRWDLAERLSGERDAYVIAEVRAFASREAMIVRRLTFAASIRTKLGQPGLDLEAGVRGAREELEGLAAELEDGELELDPACAVVCARLLNDPERSPLLNRALPPEELRSRVRQIRSGFRPRRLAA